MTGWIKEGGWRFELKIQSMILIAVSIFMTAGVGHAGDSNSVSVTATVVSRGTCWFTTETSALNFGNLDPSNPVDVNASTSVIFRCWRGLIVWFPVTFFIADDDGLYETGTNANRMRHSTDTTEFLPYSFSLGPTSGTVTGNPTLNRTLSISGTVRGVDYQDAAMGNYSDTVVVSIEP
jgi:spore coat protein U-like protein